MQGDQKTGAQRGGWRALPGGNGWPIVCGGLNNLGECRNSASPVWIKCVHLQGKENTPR